VDTADVIVREGGRSNILRHRWLLDAPPARGM